MKLKNKKKNDEFYFFSLFFDLGYLSFVNNIYRDFLILF